tara:strand:+ start:392 stop:1486 length:1095 start_codon:yes stop_codon:yes gene_type:complete
MNEKRQKLLDKLCDARRLSGLEIGPLDRPLIEKSSLHSEGEVFYLDHLSTEDLKNKYHSDATVDVDAIVEVDFVCSDGNFKRILEQRQFDYVVASHVIEHVPNPISWLQGLFGILKPGGFVFLVVPDKRFTFDYERPVTTFGNLLEAFFDKRKIPSVANVYDHYSTALKIDGGKVWSGLLDGADVVPLASKELALETANDVRNNKNYHDVHVSIFTPWSFFRILEHLIENEMFLPEVALFRDTEPYEIEFFVALKKPELEHDELKKKCSASLPHLGLENIVSPYMPQVRALSDSLQDITRAHSELASAFHSHQTMLHDEIEHSKKLRTHAETLQKMLDRKSVRAALKIAHLLNSFRRLFGRSSE